MNPRSIKNLEGVDERLKKLWAAVHEIYPIVVIEGLRSPERQALLVAEGKSKRLDGKHLLGTATDVCPYPVDFLDTNRFYFLAGVAKAKALELGIALRWGGDWDGDMDFKDQTFNDLVHFELV